jgi:enoyl-CoA hydratase/carnithine racemase
MTFENLNVSFHDSVALIRLANPYDPNNSLNTPLLHELGAAATRPADDRDVKIFLFIGTGRSFSSGADLGEFADATTDREVLTFLHRGQSLLRQILNLNAITIAAVNGLALGGGLELALACDIRWAHRRAVFGLPETRHGLVPGWGGVSLLRKTVPESLFVEMATSGEFISASRAYEAGLVSRLFTGPNFEAAALAEARLLADGSEAALREIKSLVKRERGTVDLSAGDRSFLALWKKREGSAQSTQVLS